MSLYPISTKYRRLLALAHILDNQLQDRHTHTHILDNQLQDRHTRTLENQLQDILKAHLKLTWSMMKFSKKLK
jgi:hypothetical protein